MKRPPARILHVTPQLSLGGAGRGLMTLARASLELGRFQHSVVSLKRPDPAAEAEARAIGIRFPSGPVESLIADADIVQLHFWNDPTLHAFLHSATPPRRLLLWAQVRGTTSPHVLTPGALKASTFVALSDPESLRIAGCAQLLGARRALVLPPGVDSTRLKGLKRSPSRWVRIGYLGSLDFAKLHPDFVSMSAAVRGPVRFVLAGEGRAEEALKRQVRDAGIEDRFRFLGFVRDSREFFGQVDILGHPLASGSFAAAEQAIQEAMFAGIPPVVFEGAGGSFLVRHKQTGMVAANGKQYVRHLESLAGDASLRRTLGRAARRTALGSFAMRQRAREFHAVYDQLLEGPREESPTGTLVQGAEAFVRSLGRFGRTFRQSLLGGAEEGLAADQRISRLVGGANAIGDCLLEYRFAYPTDPYLRLWAGLVLEHRERFALAALEFQQAHRDLGDGRALTHLARVRGSHPNSKAGNA